MTPRFITVGSRQVHVYSAGDGPPVVLLHPSPLSARAVLPMAEALRGRFSVHAIDTPGYGLSDPPETRPRELDDYVDGFLATFDALGIGRCALYGAATGAQLAIAIARRAPERVTLVALDSAGHFDEQETARIVDHYFPDLTPRDDGAHLATTWTMVRDLFVFFPWCDRRPAARLDRDLPPATVMHDFLLDYLRAGERYDWAYRPAFHHERVERAREVTVPALLVRWPSSVVLAATDAMIAAGLPGNFTVLRPGPTPAERYACIAAAMTERHGDASRGAAPRATPAPTGRHASAWIESEGLRLHARVRLEGTGRPLVVLHGAGGSAAGMERNHAHLLAGRPSICIDLPGHGESGAWDPDAQQRGVSSLADHVEQALGQLGIADFDALAAPLGAHVVEALRCRNPARVGELRNIGLAPGAALPPTGRLEGLAPDLAPALDGTHLWRAWQHVRDAALWSPWWQRSRASTIHAPLPPANELHARVVDLMKSWAAYPAALRCELEDAAATRR